MWWWTPVPWALRRIRQEDYNRLGYLVKHYRKNTNKKRDLVAVRLLTLGTWQEDYTIHTLLYLLQSPTMPASLGYTWAILSSSSIRPWERQRQREGWSSPEQLHHRLLFPLAPCLAKVTCPYPKYLICQVAFACKYSEGHTRYMDSVSAQFSQGESQRSIFDFVTAVSTTRAKQHRRKHIIGYNCSLLIKGSI